MTVQKVGRVLRDAREARRVELDEAAEATRIRERFLELLEDGDFAAFPGGDVQIRGFLRIYARYLNLSADDVLELYAAEEHGIAALPAETIPLTGEGNPAEPPDDLTSIRFRPRDIPVASSLPRWMSLETVVIVGIVLTVLLAILAVATYVSNQPEDGQSSPFFAPVGPIADLPHRLAVSAGEDLGVTLEDVERGLHHIRRRTSSLLEKMIISDQSWTRARDSGGNVDT